MIWSSGLRLRTTGLLLPASRTLADRSSMRLALSEDMPLTHQAGQARRIDGRDAWISRCLVPVGVILLIHNTSVAFAEEAYAPVTSPLSEELQLIKEEESVSIASRYEQPISQAPANVYVITDEDIRHSGTTDIPTLLRRIPGMEVMQTSGADFNVSVRGNNQTGANKLLVMVDGRSRRRHRRVPRRNGEHE